MADEAAKPSSPKEEIKPDSPVIVNTESETKTKKVEDVPKAEKVKNTSETDLSQTLADEIYPLPIPENTEKIQENNKQIQDGLELTNKINPEKRITVG